MIGRMDVLPQGARVALALVAVYFIALKLLFAFWAFPIADEAYYWMWGRHPALSYFDHPPLQAWLQGLSHLVLGRSLFALRWPTFAALAAIVWVFYRVARRLGGDNWRDILLVSAVIYLASPVFGFFGSAVFNDYLLVALLMLSGYFFFCFFADVEERGHGGTRDLMLAAVLLGLAGLTKYNAVFLGLGVAGTVLVRPKLRPLLGGWQIYAAAVVSAGLQAPVLVWNFGEGLASFRFHLGGRFDSHVTGLDIGRMKGVALDTASLFSLFLVPVVGRFFLSSSRDPFVKVGKTLAIWVFWLSSFTFLYIASYAWVLWWWNIAAFVLILPFAWRYIGPVLLTLHIIWGAAITTALIVSFAVVPVTVLWGAAPILEAERAYGWDDIAAAVEAARTRFGIDVLAANRYQTASQLGFALDTGNVQALSPRHDQFDYWLDAEVMDGQDAVILVDPSEDSDYWKASFAAWEKIGEIPVERFGYPLKTYELYLGKRFAGDREAAPAGK